MVTMVNKVTSWQSPLYEYHGLSTDEKPTDVPVNSIFTELDTGTSFYFSGGEWNEMPAVSGGGGGDSGESGVEKFIVTLTYANDAWTTETSIADIVSAYTDGQIVVCKCDVANIGVEFELPCAVANTLADGDNSTDFVIFSGIVYTETPATALIMAHTDDETDIWDVVVSSLVNELPAYSASEDGKVLGVSSGDLAWVEQTGGTEKLVVSLTATNNVWSADESIADIIAAHAAGQTVVAVANVDDVVAEYPLMVAASSPYTVVEFGGVSYGEHLNAVMIGGFYESNNDTWAVRYEHIEKELPAYSSSQNGKLLGITNSTPTWVDAPSGGGAEKFVVNLTKSGGTWTSDKTIAEIVAAVNANKVVEGYAIGLADFPLLLVPSVTATNEGVSVVGFYGVFGTGNNYAVYIVIGTDQGGSDYFYNSKPYLTPEPLVVDEGKVLTVGAGGVPVWADSNAPLIVALTQENGTWTAGDGVTIADVIEAYGAGKECVAIINFGQYSVEAPLTICVEQASIVVFAAATYLQSNYIVSAMGDGSGNSDSWVISNHEIADELPSFTSSNNGQVLGVSSGSLAWVPAGVSSWNDLSDKPFSETILAHGFNYEFDENTPYVSGIVDITSAELPATFYRVSETPINASDLVGAIADVLAAEGVAEQTITASDFEDIYYLSTQLDGYAVKSADFLLAFNIENDQTTMSHTSQGVTYRATFAQAGFYLMVADASAAGLGDLGCSAIAKPDTVGIVQLPEKFYKAPLFIHVEDVGGVPTPNVSFAAVQAAIANDRDVVLVLPVSSTETINMRLSEYSATSLTFLAERILNDVVYKHILVADSSNNITQTLTYYNVTQA